MKYIVIGLGVFGTNIALDLTATGAEVIGVDNRNGAVDSLKDKIGTTYLLDTTDENAISLLPLKNVDVVIVTIGDNFGASIRTVALLKKAGVKKLMVRAIDELHEAILQGMGIYRILTPEKNSALNLVNELSLNTVVEVFKVDPTHYIFKFPAPDIFVGRNYTQLTHKDFFGLRLIAATRTVKKRNLVGMTADTETLVDISDDSEKVEAADSLTFFGDIDTFRHFYRRLNEE